MKKISAIAALAAVLPTTALATDDWEFALSPYGWFSDVKGTTSTIPGQPEAPVDVRASDAADDLVAGYLLVFEASRGRHGVLMDLIYTDVRSDEDLVEELGSTLRVIGKNTLLSMAYVYGLYQDTETSLDVIAGARYWDVETILKFRGGDGPLAGRVIDNAEDWIDPLVGLKGQMPLGDSRFYLTGWAGLGGFGVNSDLFYDLSLNVGYQWTDTIGTTLGYRLLDVDYDNDGYVYDIKQDGLALGLTWRF